MQWNTVSQLAKSENIQAKIDSRNLGKYKHLHLGCKYQQILDPINTNHSEDHSTQWPSTFHQVGWSSTSHQIINGAQIRPHTWIIEM